MALYCCMYNHTGKGGITSGHRALRQRGLGNATLLLYCITAAQTHPKSQPKRFMAYPSQEPEEPRVGERCIPKADSCLGKVVPVPYSKNLPPSSPSFCIRVTTDSALCLLLACMGYCPSIQWHRSRAAAFKNKVSDHTGPSVQHMGK